MNSNELFLMVLSIISGVLLIPHIRMIVVFLITATVFIGYSITKNWWYSFAVAFILGNIYAALCGNAPYCGVVENFKSSKTKKTKKKAKVDENSEEVGEESENENEEEYFIDSKASMLENYKMLTPKQVKGLNKDTQELISTQKNLIETLKNMGPALKDGKNILDTFKNYFGDEKDINKMMKNFSVN
jgi:hypothetical protein